MCRVHMSCGGHQVGTKEPHSPKAVKYKGSAVACPVKYSWSVGPATRHKASSSSEVRGDGLKGDARGLQPLHDGRVTQQVAGGRDAGGRQGRTVLQVRSTTCVER